MITKAVVAATLGLAAGRGVNTAAAPHLPWRIARIARRLDIAGEL